jgi:phycoerythrin-associated linker protein
MQFANIDEFVQNSLGHWRSQRSAHHLAFAHFEAVRSEIDIIAVDCQDATVIELCQSYQIDPQRAVAPFKMTWEGESDWDDSEVKGSTVLVPIPDPNDPTRGKLLRERGYAETMMAAGEYHLTPDGTFVLITSYDRAAAEERIWFATPHLRFRVSSIKTSDGKGVVTASFASEIRTSS